MDTAIIYVNFVKYKLIDEDNLIVGTKDGSRFEVAVWLEKDYLANMATFNI